MLVIIDTLQMIRGAGYDNTYANDYRDLSVLKHIADILAANQLEQESEIPCERLLLIPKKRA